MKTLTQQVERILNNYSKNTCPKCGNSSLEEDNLTAGMFCLEAECGYGFKTNN